MKTKKKNVIGVCAVLGWLKDDRNFDTFLSKDKIEAYRVKAYETVSNILNCVNLTVSDTEELQRDIRDNVYDMRIVHCSERVAEKRKARKEPITVNKGDLEDLVMETLTICESCNRNTKRCNLRKTLKKIGIEESDPSKEGGCEFYYKNKKG